MNSLHYNSLKGFLLLSIILTVSSCKQSFILANKDLPSARLMTANASSQNILRNESVSAVNPSNTIESIKTTPHENDLHVISLNKSHPKFIRHEIAMVKAYSRNLNQSIKPSLPTATASVMKGGKKIDPFGIASVLFETAAVYAFFGLHMPILASVLVIAGIITAVRSIKRCNDIDKYGGESIPLIAAVFGGIALFALLLLVIILGVVVPLA